MANLGLATDQEVVTERTMVFGPRRQCLEKHPPVDPRVALHEGRRSRRSLVEFVHEPLDHKPSVDEPTRPDRCACLARGSIVGSMRARSHRFRRFVAYSRNRAAVMLPWRCGRVGRPAMGPPRNDRKRSSRPGLSPRRALIGRAAVTGPRMAGTRVRQHLAEDGHEFYLERARRR